MSVHVWTFDASGAGVATMATDRVAFASARDGQHRMYEETLRPLVAKALSSKTNTAWERVLIAADHLYDNAYTAMTGKDISTGLGYQIRRSLNAALKRARQADEPEAHRVDALTTAVVTALINEATVKATKDDPGEMDLEWVTMHDPKVRHAHQEVDGQKRKPGQRFDVAGHPMWRPGDTTAPVELWINCRCTLRPVPAEEALVAASEFKDYTPEQRKNVPTLPDGSFPIADCADLKNAIASIGRAKDPAKAKAHIRRRKAALGCTDVELPWASVTISAAEEGGFLELSEALFDEAYAEDRITEVGMREDGAIIYSITAAVDDNDLAVVALPKKGHPIHDMGPEEKHATLLFGKHTGDLTDLHKHVEETARTMKPFDANVSGHGELGPNKAKVAFVEHPSLAEARSRVALHPDAAEAMHNAPQHPHFTPHVILHNPGSEEEKPKFAEGSEEPQADPTEDPSALPETIPFDRLAVWHGNKRKEFPMKGQDAAGPEPDGDEVPGKPDVEAAVEGGASYVEAVTAAFATAEPVQSTEPDTYGPIPFHTVLAPETVQSGDGRRFAKDALTHRPLPLPYTWQKVADSEHKGNVVVGRIEKIKKIDLPSIDTGELVPMQVGTGHFLMNPEADEFVGLLAEFGRFGTSIDGDRSVASIGEVDDVVEFSEARTSSACAVPIPAFAESWIALGDAPEEWGMDEPDETADPEALVASISEAFGRGPGWITNPEATKRIHDYWTVPGQPGYNKIGWGAGHGDFYRCEAALGEEIGENSPGTLRFIKQICAQWHHDAKGIWPGQEAADGTTMRFARDSLGLQNTDAAPAFTLVASAGGYKAPAAWFSDPGFTDEHPDMVRDREGRLACPLQVTEEGQVYGHIARWGVCHTGIDGVCTVAPHSNTDYAHFRTGGVLLDNGETAAVGQLTMGGGHAGPTLTARQALAHYDSTSTAVADVMCGEDTYGIWVAGWVRPGTTDEMVTALRASSISGDWRPIGPSRQLEMIAALGVNSPGFGVPRVRIAAANGEQLSLVAAGALEPAAAGKAEVLGLDMNQLVETISMQVAQRVMEFSTRRAEMEALAARYADLDEQEVH